MEPVLKDPVKKSRILRAPHMMHSRRKTHHRLRSALRDPDQRTPDELGLKFARYRENRHVRIPEAVEV